MNNQVPSPKVKVEWEIDSKILEFIRLIKKLDKKDHISEDDYINWLLSYAVAKILKVEDLKKK